MLLPRLKELEQAGNPITIGVVGGGQMGEGLVAQTELMHGMRVMALSDVVTGRAFEVLQAAGIPSSNIVETNDPDIAAQAISEGRRVAGIDPELAWAGSVDVVVEATGIPEVGASVAYGALLAQKHVIQMNVETDATVGWLLRRMAKASNLVYTLSAGDEPGAAMELFDFATSLGFTVVSAGKGKNNPLDRSATPDSVAEKAKSQMMNPKMLASFVDGSKTMVEMTALANATGLVPDVRGMHGPEATPSTIATTYIPKADGGVFSGEGRVDYGLGIAPGVFVVITAQHPKIIRDLKYLQLGPGPYWSLYRPYHLTSLETPISIARAVLDGDTTAATDETPTAETVAVAKRDLHAGEVIDGLGGYCSYGMIETARTAHQSRMLPLGLAPGATLTNEVPMGNSITYDDVELDENLTIVHLRRLQDLELRGAYQ